MNRSKLNKSPSPSKGSKHGPKHWSHRMHETIVFAGTEGLLNLVVQGGAENGQFCYIGEIRQDKINYHSGKLHHDEIILEIQGEKVAGYTLRDLLDWLKHVSKNGQPVLFKTVKSGLLTRDLREYLNTRFQKNSLDHDLQQKIRDNVYKRTVPCTTRTQRPGEIDGVDYKFLTVEDFLALEKSGNLLESGLYDGNHYGTPKPSKDPADNPFRRTNSMGTLLPGQHPSSEGKRRRNRSNIEITTNRSSISRYPSDNLPPMLTRKKSLERAQSTSSLGPLPPNWEMSFTEDGVPYFIDHTSETTHWLDPRLATNQKIDPLQCNVDELPYGWEKVEDSVYGAYFIDHVNRKTQYENPVVQAKRLAKERAEGKTVSDPTHFEINGRKSPPSYESHRPVFTKNPADLKGKFIRTELLKSPRGFGFTIVGGEDSDTEFLQIKNVVPNGPAFDDGKFQRGDVLVYVNTQCVLGYTHQDVVSIFQTIPIGGKVALEVCRGYPLPFDPDDPNTEIVTTVAVTLPNNGAPTHPPSLHAGHLSRGSGTDMLSVTRRSNKSLPDLSRTHNNNGMLRNRSFEEIHAEDSTDSVHSTSPNAKPQIYSINIVKGPMGFGFTIADSAYGQKVKQILDRPRCKNLQEGDILVEINHNKVKDMAHSDVVKVLKECSKGTEATVVIQRGGILTPSRARKHVDRTSPAKTLPAEDRLSSEPTYSNVPRTPFYNPEGKKEGLESDQVSKPTVVPPGEPDGHKQDDKPLSKREDSKNLVDSNQSDIGDANQNAAMGEAEQLTKSPAVSRSKTPSLEPSSRPHAPSELRSKTPTAEMMSQMGRGGDHRYGNRPPFADLQNSSAADRGRPGHPVPRQDLANSGYDPRGDFSTPGYSPPQQDLTSPGMTDLDRGHGADGRFRSRTPGPDFMRPRDPDDEHRIRKTPEMRSKTPTNDYNQSRPSSTMSMMSGTPDFIPASLYQNPPSQPPSSRHVQHSHPSNNTQHSGPSRSSDPARNNMEGYSPSSRYNSSSYSNSPNLTAPSRSYKPQVDTSQIPLSPSMNHTNPRKQSTSFEHEEPSPSNLTRLQKWNESPGSSLDRSRSPARAEDKVLEMTVTLRKQDNGFGFRIIGGTEEGSQVSVGYIVPGGSADVDGRLRPGDEIIYVDNHCVLGTSHHKIVTMMGQCSSAGQVTLTVRRKPHTTTDPHLKGQLDGYPYDVTVTRRENEGFGFVIISSVTRAGSVIDEKNNFKFQSSDWVMNIEKPHPWIGKIIEGSPAERCGGLHIGDRILTVNRTDISQMHHEEIVNLIKMSGYSVTLAIGPPQAADDTSSTTSNSQRVGSSQGSMVNAMAYPAQSESDLSRRSDYSPYHSPQPQSATTQHSNRYPHQPVLDKQRDLQRQRNMSSQPSSSESSSEEDKYYAVELHRGSRGFGFSIRGGKEFDNMSLFVLRIADGGAADQDSRLRVGDQIIEINGYNTNNMTHADAIELISSGGSTVKLLVKRTGKLPVPAGMNSGPALRPPSTNPGPLPNMPNGPIRALGHQGSPGQGSPSGTSRNDTRSPYLYTNSNQYNNSQHGRTYLGY